MAGGKKRKGGKAGRSNKKKQRRDQQGAEEEQKQIELPVVPQPPISRLYRDALQSVFKFCSVAELSHVMAVSHSWPTAVNQMPCAQFVVYCTMPRLVSVCTSTLSKHVSSIGEAGYKKSGLSCEALYTLSFAMPQLTALNCILLPSESTKVILPHRLKTLELDLSKLNVAAVNAAIKGIAQLNALGKLKLILPSFLHADAMSFASLASVASLKELELSSAQFSQPSPAQLDQLRALSQLRKMAVDGLSSHFLAQLLRTPHELR